MSNEAFDNLVNMVGNTTADEPASEEITGGTDEPVEEVQTEEAEDSQELEAESESEEADTDEQDEDSDPQDWYTVKVGGEEIEVTLDEALKGYQRDADYRKKTMTLAEERKAVEQEKARIGQLVGDLESFVRHEEESVDWEELRRENPEEYIARKDKLEQAQKAKEQAQKEQQKFYQDLVNKESKALIDAMGGDDIWSVDQRNTDIKLASDYLQDKGFKDEDIGQIIDHRLWTVIIDAAKSQKYKQTEAKVKEGVRKAPKSVKPGQKVAPSERKRKTASNKIKNARTREEGTAALADLIKLQRGN